MQECTWFPVRASIQSYRDGAGYREPDTSCLSLTLTSQLQSDTEERHRREHVADESGGVVVVPVVFVDVSAVEKVYYLKIEQNTPSLSKFALPFHSYIQPLVDRIPR